MGFVARKKLAEKVGFDEPHSRHDIACCTDLLSRLHTPLVILQAKQQYQQGKDERDVRCVLTNRAKESRRTSPSGQPTASSDGALRTHLMHLLTATRRCTTPRWTCPSWPPSCGPHSPRGASSTT